MESRKVVPRGVYSLPFYGSRGERLIVAVDSSGRSLGGPVRVFRCEEKRTVVRMLRAVLDELDPQG